MTAKELHELLLKQVNPQKAAFLPYFFKTGPGEYGEGDEFIGVTVPNIRNVAKTGKDLPLSEIQRLLRSKWHEDRLLAVILLVMQFEKDDKKTKTTIFDFYLHNTEYVNNWDIVDSSARQIVGGYLFAYPNSKVLTSLAASTDMWERRIAMIATHYFLMKGEPGPTLEIATLLINDSQDLMHKAVGWMLREMGKRVDPNLLRDFLEKHAATMPRTTLRYAIEHFSPKERKKWLAMRGATGVS